MGVLGLFWAEMSGGEGTKTANGCVADPSKGMG